MVNQYIVFGISTTGNHVDRWEKKEDAIKRADYIFETGLVHLVYVFDSLNGGEIHTLRSRD